MVSWWGIYRRHYVPVIIRLIVHQQIGSYFFADYYPCIGNVKTKKTPKHWTKINIKIKKRQGLGRGKYTICTI